MENLSFKAHDHSHCISDALGQAKRYCAEHGLQFTPTRHRVLEILLEEHRALGAYDILEKLREDGKPAQPPVAYRALDFLVKHGFAHKIERLSAFVACAHPGADHMPAFLICESCDHVAEVSATLPPNALRQMADASGFTIQRTVIEATGTCPNCEASAA